MSHLPRLVLFPCLALLALALLVRLPPRRVRFSFFLLICCTSGACRDGRVSAGHLPPHPLGRLRARPAPPPPSPTQWYAPLPPRPIPPPPPPHAQTPDLTAPEVHSVWSRLRGGGRGQRALHGVRAGVFLAGGRQRQLHPVPAPFLLERHPLRPVQLFGRKTLM